MTEQLTAEQIRIRLETEQYGYHDDGDDWDYELAKWLSTIDIDAAMAWAHAQEDHDSDATFSPNDLADVFRSTYQGYYDSASEFARDRSAVADSPLLSDYSMVRIGGDDDAHVHVFLIRD